MITLIVISGIVLLILLFILISNFISSHCGSPYLKSKKEIIKKSLELSGLKKGERFYDLGSGNGDVLIAAAKMGVKAIGTEISPYYYIYSKFRTWGKRNILIFYADIGRIDLSRADIIYCYLMPVMLKKLAPKFKKELKKSARVISIDFQIPDFSLVNKVRYRHQTIYIYSLSSRSA